ncbi:MAG: nitrate ABC transporter permease [Leifsonia xyli]|nr:MAG: nitrate ABC transporter permease [Leifsonia xyli]
MNLSDSNRRPGRPSALASRRRPATASAPSSSAPSWLRFAAPVFVGVLIVVAWTLYVEFGDAPRMLPAPAAVGQEFVDRWGIIWDDMLITATNALIGLTVGAVLAVILAGLAAAWRPVDGMLAPLIAALAVIPIVAITPILNTMFGASSQFGRQAVATIAAFIPVFINVLRGLRQTRPVHRDLLRASAANGAQTFRLLTLPTALPYLMTGLRVASSLAVIAALVAEYFGGPSDGIGTSIATYAKSGRAALAWAYVGGGIIIGLVFFLVTSLLERLVTRHAPV